MVWVTKQRGQTILHTDVNQYATYLSASTAQNVSRYATDGTSFADAVRQETASGGVYSILRAGYGTAGAPTWMLNVTSTGAGLGTFAGGAGGIQSFGAASAAPGTVGVGSAGANANHLFTVYELKTGDRNSVYVDYGDESYIPVTHGTLDNAAAYFRSVQGDVNDVIPTELHGWSSIRPLILANQRRVTADTPGYAAHLATYGVRARYNPITGTGQGTRILEAGLASSVGRAGALYIDELCGLYVGNQAFGQLDAGVLGVEGAAAFLAHGIDNWQWHSFWLGPIGYPGQQGYPDSYVTLGSNNSGTVLASGAAGTTGTRGTIGADRTRPFFCVYRPGRIGILTATPSYAFHAKALSSTDVANWTYPATYTATTTMIQVEMDSAATAPAHIVAAGLTDAAKQLVMGIDTTSNIGTIQAYSAASTATGLTLQPAGSKVGIGTKSITGALHVLPETAATIVEVIQGRTSQSANLTEWWNISQSVLASISAAGSLTFSGAEVQSGVVATAPGASVNDYNPAGLATTKTLRVTPTAGINITGIAAQTTGFVLRLLNGANAFDITLTHEDAASTASNRFNLPNNASVVIRRGGGVDLFYDGTVSRWKAVSI